MGLRIGCACASIVCVVMAASGSARAGTFASIAVDGTFADWSGVPVISSDPIGDGAPIDFADIQIANDDANLYLRVNYHTPVNPNRGPSVFLGIDADNNTATGFNVYGLGVVGSEAAFQNDFPFEQRTGFNSGGLSAAATIAPVDFANATTLFTSQEYSIPRSITYTSDGVAVFGSSFTLLIYTDGSPADTTAGLAYTFAVVPEPATLTLGVASLGLLSGRRRR